MKIHRFIGSFDLSKKEINIVDKEIVNQMKNVLRLKVGELVEVCDGINISAIAEIIKIEKDNINVSIKETIKDKNKTKNDVILFCAILKKENFELVVQKTTETGVSKIVPIITSRTIKNGLNMERLRKIAKEASEQCGRTNVPIISEPITFDESLKLINNKNTNMIFNAEGELTFETHYTGRQSEHSKFSAENYVRVSKDNSLTAEQINIFIGPEGGWTEEEIEKTKNLDFKTASLGPLILRGETAAIVATYLISNLQ
ncbi:MAG: RsmE family RNA methyltransferase [bacterium]